MVRMKSGWLLIAFFMSMVVAQAQENAVGNWLVYSGMGRLNQAWSIAADVQYRSYNYGSDVEQIIIRPMFNYHLAGTGNTIGLGYGFVHTKPYVGDGSDRISFNEHRIFQQLLTRQFIERVALIHRYRFEQRFFEDDFRLRFRYGLIINAPLNKREIERGTLYAALSNEVFLNTAQRIFDRNRLFVGLGYGISRSLRLEGGLLYQIFETNNRPQIQLTLLHNFHL